MSEGWWAIVGVLVGAISTGLFNLLFQTRQFRHNKEMFQLQNKGKENVKALLHKFVEPQEVYLSKF